MLQCKKAYRCVKYGEVNGPSECSETPEQAPKNVKGEGNDHPTRDRNCRKFRKGRARRPPSPFRLTCIQSTRASSSPITNPAFDVHPCHSKRLHYPSSPTQQIPSMYQILIFSISGSNRKCSTRWLVSQLPSMDVKIIKLNINLNFGRARRYKAELFLNEHKSPHCTISSKLQPCLYYRLTINSSLHRWWCSHLYRREAPVSLIFPTCQQLQITRSYSYYFLNPIVPNLQWCNLLFQQVPRCPRFPKDLILLRLPIRSISLVPYDKWRPRRQVPVLVRCLAELESEKIPPLSRKHSSQHSRKPIPF